MDNSFHDDKLAEEKQIVKNGYKKVVLVSCIITILSVGISWVADINDWSLVSGIFVGLGAVSATVSCVTVLINSV